MTRNLKALGLALLAVFALGATAASGASAAEHFASEVDHTILTGTQVGTDKFKTDGGTVTCSTANYEGTILSETTTTPTVEVTPEYSGCKAFGFLTGTEIHHNGCKYRFHAEEVVDIVCSGGVIEVTVKAFGELQCTVTIPAQNGIPGTVTYTNEGENKERDVKVDVNLTGIKYTQHPGPGVLPCEEVNHTTVGNGTYEGHATVKGEDTEEHQVGIWVT